MSSLGDTPNINHSQLYYHFLATTTIIFIKRTKYEPVDPQLFAAHGPAPDTELRIARTVSPAEAGKVIERCTNNRRPVFIDSLENLKDLPQGKIELFISSSIADQHAPLQQWIRPYEVIRPDVIERLIQESIARRRKAWLKNFQDDAHLACGDDPL